MKNTIYLLLFVIAILSCQSQTKQLANKKDYSFLTDSLKINPQLKKHNLAGFSLVVIENYEVVYSNQFGLKSMNTNEKIDINTAFSTASIAKPITAILCHILEEKGLINLDDPIDNYLKRWHLPKSPFTKNNKPTWKHFLNHTAGTSQHGFTDFYAGDTIPTIKQSLMGKLPRYDKEIEFLFTPGESWKYSGGGYVIIQMALEDTLKKSIAALADEHIFSPLGLENTTMIQPSENGFLTNVALVHDKNNEVIKTGLPITPQVGPSGLWSTPTDLAKFTIELQNALRNKNNKVISHNIAKKVTEVTALQNAVGGWSYGGQRSYGYNNYEWLRCGGSNTGVGGDIFATMTDGNGFIYLANGEKPNRFPVIGQTRIKLLTLMGWGKESLNEEFQEIPIGLKKKLIGNYEDFLYGVGLDTKIVERNNRMYVECPFLEHYKGKNDNELLYLKNGTFKIIDYPNRLKFNFNDNKPNYVTITRGNLNIEMPMISITK